MFWHDYWWMVLVGILLLPVVGVVLFGAWLGRRPGIDLETGTRCWETFVKLVSAFTVIVSGAMLFGKYIDQQGALERSRQVEFARELALREAEFLEQKLSFDTSRHDRASALLREAKQVAARIASLDAPDPTLLTRFDELYFADLIGAEQPGGAVERAMVRYRRKLHGLEGAPPDSLYELSLQLSRAVELELRASESSLLEQHRRIAELVGSGA